MSTEELSSWLSMFVVEMRRPDGKPYPGSTLKHILAGILQHLHSEYNTNVNFFKDPSFSLLHKVLDSRMKDCRSEGVELKTKQADPITDEEEMRLWDLNILEDSSPQQLVDTMVYMRGLYFPLPRGYEHRRLRTDQLHVLNAHSSISLIAPLI